MTDTTRADLLQAVRDYLTRTIQASGRASQEDVDTWREFYERYNLVLLAFASRLKFRSQEIEDLVQDVWQEVIRKLPEFNYDSGRGGFRRWLYTLVRRRAIDHARRQAREPRHAGADLGRLADDRAPDPETILDRQFKAEILALAVRELRHRVDANHWSAFELCRLQGKTSKEAGEALDVSPETTRKRLQRASDVLREILLELVGEGDLGPLTE